MNKTTLRQAKEWAELFLVRARDMEAVLENDEDDIVMVLGCNESAALKRTSMDLSRALTKLRAPG